MAKAKEEPKVLEHQMHEAGCSFNTQIYHPSGKQIQWTFRVPFGDPEPAEKLIAAINNLAHHGYTMAPPGLEPGQEKQSVVGWVYGKKKDGEPCVWVYPGGGWKHAIDTIWKENFAALPFDVSDAKQWPTAQKPEKDEAQKSDFWNAFECEVAYGDHPKGYKKDNGEPKQVILKWIDLEPVGGSRDEDTQEEDPSDLNLYEVREFDHGKENFFALMEAPMWGGKAKKIVVNFQSWLAVCESKANVEYIRDSVSEAFRQEQIREISVKPLNQMCDKRLGDLKVEDEIPT